MNENNPEEEEYFIAFFVKGLVAPSKEFRLNDVLIKGVFDRNDCVLGFQFKKNKKDGIEKFVKEKSKKLVNILQIYGLVTGQGLVTGPIINISPEPGYSHGPVINENPLKGTRFVTLNVETTFDEQSKEKIFKPLIEKAITKYTVINDIYENKNTAFLRNAIDYYNRSLNDEKLEEKLIDLMISLESLFSNENDELTLRYSLRVAFLVGCGQEDKRSEIFNLVKNLYKIRSKIVHGTSEVNIEVEEVNQFNRIINQSIRTLLHFGLNKQSILNLLDEAVYSDAKKEELSKLVIGAIAEW